MLRKTTLDRPLEHLLTDRARRALDLAEQQARNLGHDRVTADHLLMSLIYLDEGVAVTTLRSLGCDLRDIHAHATGVGLGHVVVLARREAAGLRHRYIGTEHFLLGLLNEEGTAAALGVGLHQTRAQVIKVLHGEAY
ncbi:Clp protease N-terminal domain-containing protein [Nonomuraea sp. M3C6]|uniref:Clp protease N-terminal domain-containing protein n=1 Tax=Nonomuraea marmarensis TaxID=3351344 RepID=A0ABW7AXN1_9ACTN